MQKLIQIIRLQLLAVNKMGGNLVERRSCGIHYYVDPTTPSDIYFEKDVLQRLNADDCELSVTELSKYLREHSVSFSPVLLTWEMTSRCNFNCPFCYIRDNSKEDNIKEIQFKHVKETLDYMILEGLFEVFLSGGECLLLEDFIDIYTYLKKNGVFVTVFTNGSLINEKIIECWKKYPSSSVEITLYNDDFFSKPFCNVLRLREMGIHVQPKFTLTNTTLCYYDAVLKWSSDHNLKLAVDSEIFDGVDENHINIESNYSLSVEQKKIYNPERYLNLAKEYKVRTGFPCQSKKGIVHIAPDFSFSLCNKMKIRWDLWETNIETAISELKTLILEFENKSLNGCLGCVYSQKCSMCYANAEFINGELYVPKGYCESLQKKCQQFDA